MKQKEDSVSKKLRALDAIAAVLGCTHRRNNSSKELTKMYAELKNLLTKDEYMNFEYSTYDLRTEGSEGFYWEIGKLKQKIINGQLSK
jgi:UDP-N-acetylglucosamine 2-epimerase